ncbi:AAA family ATPase [Oscillibacter sp.]|uniref:ATP-dependent nuclease n=1 Tax=Oscillibacter sp. TaxID=1945593 RepID=UPI00289E46F7|nr:AAA family ATPase [Oscillibacter sp.]
MSLEIGVKLNRIKNINEFDYVFHFDCGIYALVGENAVGKSTVMAAIASTVYPKVVSKYTKTEITNDSSIELQCKGKSDKLIANATGQQLIRIQPSSVVFNGIYEGSIFSGTRFADMKNIDEIAQNSPEFVDELIPASDELKKALSFILHGEPGHYEDLYKFKTYKIAQRYGLENMPYFLKLPDGQCISKYKMSSGECLLISLLNFIISTALKPRFLKFRKQPVDDRMFIFVDEVELALHPSSIIRLISFLEDMIKINNLTVLFSTHSSELIRRIIPERLFLLENNMGKCQITSPCYPQYAIRSLYDHDGYDSTILVEDILAEIVIRKIIQEFRIKNNLLINVIPVGAWNNTLSFQKRAIEQNAFGRDRFVFSVIDGDVKDTVNKVEQFRALRKLFLPIKSVEKYLLHKLVLNPDLVFIRQIGNKYFTLDSIESILKIAKLNSSIMQDATGKKLLDLLCEYLDKLHLDKEAFVKDICDDIFLYENFDKLKASIENFITNNFSVTSK